MRLIHLSDLHIGKRVNEFSMLEDQEYILKRILNIIDDKKPDGVIIAGDVYDRTMPSEDAVKLLDWFLTSLAKRKLQVYIISGNHDSAVKLSFASGLIDLSGIHIAPVYNGKVEPMRLEGSDGISADIYMLPFVKPVTVKNIFKDEAEDIKDYTSACRVAIEHMDIDETATIFLWLISLLPVQNVRIQRRILVDLIMWMWGYLPHLTMWHWDISTDRRR